MEYVAAAVLGFAGGTLGGLVGVGGGIVFVPALAIFLDQSQVRAEATSLLAIVFVAALGAWRQHGYGNVRVRDGIVLGVVSPLGVAAGVAISNAVPERTLELLFAGLALVFAAQLLRRVMATPRSEEGP
ncbi:MAG: hypothetical protein AUG48_03735 [Actinobacteria bacterium 13_1_20CM_3_68_9]|nr:MAG: hypothetical protein AUG48_03735 [Actinobacteria bacterium 13_1_20CM_3_68_9]